MADTLRNDPNPTPPSLYDTLKELRSKFFDALIKLVEQKGEDGKAIIPSHQEMTVIRGVLRDNGMNLPPEDPEALAQALRLVKEDLPSFDDIDDEDGGEE